MTINNRGQLIDLINKFEVITYPIISKKSNTESHTVIHNKKINRFYRLIWGEVLDEQGVRHMWFNKKAEEVYLNAYKSGWHTKEETNNFKWSNKGECKMKNIYEDLLKRPQGNLVNLSVADKEGLVIMGGKTGSGKSIYALAKAVDSLIDGDSVLLFSTERNSLEIREKMIDYVKCSSESKLSQEDKLNLLHKALKEGKLVVDDTYTICDNYIIELATKLSQRDIGLNLVIVDHLNLVINNQSLNNYNEVDKVYNRLNEFSDRINCKILMTVQLNANFNN